LGQNASKQAQGENLVDLRHTRFFEGFLNMQKNTMLISIGMQSPLEIRNFHHRVFYQITAEVIQVMMTLID
jgi:hypothetical protein